MPPLLYNGSFLEAMMLDTLFHYLSLVDEFFWVYVAFILIATLGTILTVSARFFQIFELPNVIKTFIHFLKTPNACVRGVHPLRTFFASVGGMIGIGNLVGIVMAVKLGGPGALLWVWLAGMVGAIIKYGEIYLGLKYRVANAHGGYDGGPLYFLRAAFKTHFFSILAALLLCIYGVEIYIFSIVTDSVSVNWNINRYIVVAILLLSTLYAGLGGVRRTGKICTLVMPLFLVLYILMTLWILALNASALPAVIVSVFQSAFTGHAAVGAFAGCSVLLTIQYGVARAAYSADIGIGYDSIIQSESSTVYPERQAKLAILGVLLDNIICTLSILLVLVTGVWSTDIPGSTLVQTALGFYFPYMDLFMPFFLIVCGYTTIIAYFCVGLKCARFLWAKGGTKVYTVYAILAFILFSFVDQTQAMTVMSISGALLLITNLLGIFRLRKEIAYTRLSPQELEVETLAQLEKQGG